jgi:hypothetical protein
MARRGRRAWLGRRGDGDLILEEREYGLDIVLVLRGSPSILLNGRRG